MRPRQVSLAGVRSANLDLVPVDSSTAIVQGTAEALGTEWQAHFPPEAPRGIAVLWQ